MKVKVGSVVLGLVVIACLQRQTFAGTIVSWGSMKTPYDGLSGIAAIAAGGGHTLFLKPDGSIFGWGNSDFGQATAPVGNDFVAITAGGRHSLALKKNGSIFGWGWNQYGEARAPDGNDFVAISADRLGCVLGPRSGRGYSLALKKDGSIVGWGSNYDRDGNWVGQATPPDGNDYIAISAGGTHSLALKKDGSIVGWGANNSGQAAPPDGNNFIAIAAGSPHSLAIKQVCQYRLAGDINDDCKVDFYDFALMAANWLIDCNIEPTSPSCIPK